MEEQPEVQESTIEEQLNPETSKPTKLNKNGKPRKQLSPEALERLAKAREKANAMRQQAYAKKLEEKVEKIKGKTEEQQKLLPTIADEEETNDDDKAKPEVVLPEPEKEIKQVASSGRNPLTKPNKKTKIIVYQSSDASEEFEPNDNVVFVKRVSRKKKEPAVEEKLAYPESKVEMELPPPPPPKPRDLTPQQRLLKSQYESMFSGGFMNQGNMMRTYY